MTAPVVIFVALFGARFVPPAGAPLRVMIFNLHYALADEQLAEMIALIRAQDADLIALQELSIPAAALRQHLSQEYPYQELSPATSYTGVGVISRYPLRAPADQRRVPGQLLQVNIGAQPITLINANLTAPDLERGSLPLLPPALQITSMTPPTGSARLRRCWISSRRRGGR